jgi:hypothetical protein
MIIIRYRGNFDKSEKFLSHLPRKNYRPILEKYGAQGVTSLSSFTPKDTGETANSWSFKIETGQAGIKLVWSNSNIVQGTPLAILLQYGHGTRNGGYVEGLDFINPAMRPIFDQIVENLWKEVISL